MQAHYANIFRILHKEVVARISIAAVLFWVPIIIFTAIASEVVERQPVLFDAWVLNTLHHHASKPLDHIVLFVTNLGDVGFLAPTALTLAIVLVLLQRIHDVRVLIFGLGGAALMNLVLKSIFRRDRPSLWQTIITEKSYSFPSGHAMASSAFAFCLIAITWNTRWRWPVLVLGLVYVLAIGLSRNYLGVHYPSDVIAGWCISGAWVLFVAYVLNPSNRHGWLGKLPGFKRK